MGFFDLFGGGANIEEGIETFKNTPGAKLIDVRTPDEYKAGHIPGAVNLPLDKLSTIKYKKDTKLFLYCHSGARSRRGFSQLTGLGFTEVTDIGGLMRYTGPLR